LFTISLTAKKITIVVRLKMAYPCSTGLVYSDKWQVFKKKKKKKKLLDSKNTVGRRG
jgi:hypothetical protein